MTSRIRRGREICGLSLAQAAHLLGWAQGSLHAVEEGVGHPPSDADLRVLADLYQTTVAWLLGDPPQISAENQALLRDDRLTLHDRDVVEEVIGMWSTPERE